MSTSHKPTLHLDHSGAVVIGRQSKSDPSQLVGEVLDVSARFQAIVLAVFGPVGEGSQVTEWIGVEDPSEEGGMPKTSRIRITVERIPNDAK